MDFSMMILYCFNIYFWSS